MFILVSLLAAAAPTRATTAADSNPGFELAPTQAEAAAPAEHKWTGSVAVAASMSSGNTDKTALGATGQAENRGADDRWTAQLLWNYADEKGVGVTQRRTYGQVKYDRFFSKQFYGYGVLSGENDFNAALDLRATLGGGAGYQFREDEEWKISGEAGLSYIDENFSTAGDDQSYLSARLAYKFDCVVDGGKWTAGQWGELFPSVEDAEDLSVRVDSHARVTLTEKMFAQLQHVYTWDNTPATGADRVDELWLLSIGWSF
ncbi:MAG: DUF481 domain-containing protein [Planctomycetes bacterium]|nr:DUF481 domain-containing protein [Planctomycetota bacterium]